MKKKLSIVFMLVAMLLCAIPASARTFNLTGKVGKYPIAMQLNVSDGYVSGKYRYTNHNYGWIDLSGSMDNWGTYKNGVKWWNLTFYEYTNGNVTGTWNLTLKSNGTCSGNMTNYKGKTFPVNLR